MSGGKFNAMFLRKYKFLATNKGVLSSYEYFDFISEDKETSLSGYAGSSFQIKSAIDFEQTHILIEKAIEIINTKKIKNLGSFSEIKDSYKIEQNYKPKLYEAIRDDMMIQFSQGGYKEGDKRFDFDFGHPSQLLEFYECDNYIVTAKNVSNPIVETTHREDIYKKTMEYIVMNEDLPLLGDFMRFVGGLIVQGQKANKKPIKSPFSYCISCELTDENNKSMFGNLISKSLNSVQDYCAISQ